MEHEQSETATITKASTTDMILTVFLLLIFIQSPFSASFEADFLFYEINF